MMPKYPLDVTSLKTKYMVGKILKKLKIFFFIFSSFFVLMGVFLILDVDPIELAVRENTGGTYK